MSVIHQLENVTKTAVKELFQVDLEKVEVTLTRKDQNGHFTIMVFPMLRQIKGNPAVIGEQIGAYLQENTELIGSYEVIKGFLNVTLTNAVFIIAFNEMLSNSKYGFTPVDDSSPGIMVEYSSPNTNKPLHLGHIRNNLLGYSVAQILEASGRRVNKTQIINDRGIHICKSMLAWQEQGNGETPESTGLKGDKLVGNYYVKFDKQYKEEIAQLINEGIDPKEAEKQAPSLLKAQEMLRKWEAGDPETVALWEKMNGWVYDGFEVTYNNLGVSFDSLYYESNTYLLGKDIIEEGLQKGVFFKKDDGSVWIDLSDEGLDEKLVLRSDGTAVYMTQDIGTAIQRVKDHPINAMVYTVGNEQDYHFKVLFLILKKLGYDWAENLHHLSYGMVELPSGKMKSREGTVVDADDLMEEMTATARKIALEQGKLDGLSAQEQEDLFKIIGLGALKYFMLKIDPVKNMMFNPEESVDFQGNTGPFIQYAHARIKSILKKAQFDSTKLNANSDLDITDKDIAIIKTIEQFPDVIHHAATKLNPASIANYTYELVREFNSFYQNVPKIVEEENADLKQFRLLLCYKTALVIKDACSLLGIDVPEQM
ncbi:arginyl-tRNA synthetase [Nonlabens sp. MIC269]|uniref:arginine--tRNA ligase n=1 Tax=Nonlabens sp. MIC269 TaxID=1476901 RepID=UPI00071EA085|nr:arginine--tRNA ligase [Nonlabens sp. MIC269]ALM22119.1 arginyl-tRNA synthetase [Nonlabens sp. MIC269]